MAVILDYTITQTGVLNTTVLAALDVTELDSGVRVAVTGTNSIYTYDATNTETADGTRVVSPDSGTGRWIQICSEDLQNIVTDTTTQSDTRPIASSVVNGFISRLSTAYIDSSAIADTLLLTLSDEFGLYFRVDTDTDICQPIIKNTGDNTFSFTSAITNSIQYADGNDATLSASSSAYLSSDGEMDESFNLVASKVPIVSSIVYTASVGDVYLIELKTLRNQSGYISASIFWSYLLSVSLRTKKRRPLFLSPRNLLRRLAPALSSRL